jgi:predicted phosphodiesterase
LPDVTGLIPIIGAASEPRPGPETYAGSHGRVAFFGGIYSNYLALAAAHDLARSLRVDAVFALGDFGAFGPHPDRTVDFLRARDIPCIQGNYEEALVDAAEDCRCGYTDPRDNHYARISFDYTAARTSARHKDWMAGLPRHLRLEIGGTRVLCCHGSPRRINEFLWASSTSDAFLRKLLEEYETDLLVCTHTGLHWSRFLAPGNGGPARGIVNVGALGRPANNGRTEVWFAVVDAGGSDGKGGAGRAAKKGGLRVEFVPVPYDHARLAREMEAEGLPPEFRETILTGWWTTCLEILPAKERAAGRF